MCSPADELLFFSLAGLLKGHSGRMSDRNTTKWENEEVTESNHESRC